MQDGINQMEGNQQENPDGFGWMGGDCGRMMGGTGMMGGYGTAY